MTTAEEEYKSIDEIFEDWAYGTNSDKAVCLRLIKEFVEKQLSEHSTKEQWISVDERLPEPNQDVFICFINSVGTHVGESTFKNDIFYYVAETDMGYFEEPYSIITHWQPLPAAPVKKTL